MTTEELKMVKCDKLVDARGTACPGPLLAAKMAIGSVLQGQIMEVLSADEGTKSDIPKWAKKQNFEYLGSLDEDGIFRLFIKK